MFDSGASTCFIDISFVRAHNIPIVRTTQPISVEAIDGRVLSSRAITEATIPLVLQIGPHQKVLTFYLIASPRHSIVLGLSWLETHNLTVDWRNRSITFSQTPTGVTTPHNVTCVGASLSLVAHSSDSNSVSHTADSVEANSNLVASVPVVSQDVPAPVTNLPTRYNDFLDMFEKRNADQLLAHCRCDFPIELQDGMHPPFVPINGYLHENLRLFAHTWMKTSLRASFNPPNHRSAPPSYLSRRRTAHYDYVWINEVLTKLQCVIVIPCPQFQHSSIDSESGISSPKLTFKEPSIWCASSLETSKKWPSGHAMDILSTSLCLSVSPTPR